jgi:hypothetical protein
MSASGADSGGGYGCGFAIPMGSARLTANIPPDHESPNPTGRS